MNEFEAEVLLAEIETLRVEVARIRAQHERLVMNTRRAEARARHHLAVKRAMHDRLDALYRRTKTERDAALDALRERVA